MTLPRISALVLAATAIAPDAARAWMDEAAVSAAVRAGLGASCYAMSEEAVTTGTYSEPPVRIPVTVPADEAAEAQDYVVWQIYCDTGAYNASYAFWIEDETFGLRPLAFPKPIYAIELEDPVNYESAVTGVTLTGWTAADRLINGDFDPLSRRFSHFGKFRGLADAFDAGTWELGHGGARILTYEVDASYDDRQNPILIYPAP